MTVGSAILPGERWRANTVERKLGRGEVPMEIGLSPKERFHCLQQGTNIAFRTETPYASSFGLFPQLSGRLRRDKKMRDFRLSLRQSRRRFQTVHFWHQEIHHRDVRRAPAPRLDGFTAIGGFTHDNPFRHLFEHSSEIGSNSRIVVD